MASSLLCPASPTWPSPSPILLRPAELGDLASVLPRSQVAHHLGEGGRVGLGHELAGDGLGETGDGWRLEEAGDRQLDLELLEHPRQHLVGVERVAAEGEEVVVDTD